MRKILLVLFGFLTIVSAEAQVKAKTKVLTRPDSCRVLISFYSVGTGVNTEAAESFRAFVKKYEEKNKKTLSMGETPWGREGEVDYCMSLRNLTSNQTVKFIKDLRKQLGNQEHVRIEEHKPNINKH